MLKCATIAPFSVFVCVAIMDSLKSPRKKRSVRLACHLTPEELERFSEICSHAGLTLSTATRVLIFRAIAEGRIEFSPSPFAEQESADKSAPNATLKD